MIKPDTPIFPWQQDIIDKLTEAHTEGRVIVINNPRDHGKAQMNVDLMLQASFIPISLPEYEEEYTTVEKNMIAHEQFLESIRKRKRGNRF